VLIVAKHVAASTEAEVVIPVSICKIFTKVPRCLWEARLAAIRCLWEARLAAIRCGDSLTPFKRSPFKPITDLHHQMS
jgi:hypothetical protein